MLTLLLTRSKSNMIYEILQVLISVEHQPIKLMSSKTLDFMQRSDLWPKPIWGAYEMRNRRDHKGGLSSSIALGEAMAGADGPARVAQRADHLVQLQRNQDSNSQAWMRFLVATQSGLGAALGYILLSGTLPLTGIKTALGIVIAVFGILTSLAIGRIIKRQHQWSAWYVVKYNLLPGYRGVVFPVDEKLLKATTIDEMRPGKISGTIWLFCRIMAVVWFLIGVVLLTL
jgi:hypothetical protein